MVFFKPVGSDPGRQLQGCTDSVGARLHRLLQMQLAFFGSQQPATRVARPERHLFARCSHVSEAEWS